MKRVTHKPLDKHLAALRDQLGQAVEQINQADALLTGEGSDAMAKATALLLSAIARVYVLETAEKLGVDNRLLTFLKRPTP